jgi:hypothetical protein
MSVISDIIRLYNLCDFKKSIDLTVSEANAEIACEWIAIDGNIGHMQAIPEEFKQQMRALPLEQRLIYICKCLVHEWYSNDEEDEEEVYIDDMINKRAYEQQSPELIALRDAIHAAWLAEIEKEKQEEKARVAEGIASGRIPVVIKASSIPVVIKTRSIS